MTTYVLVAGCWLGGWAWEDVTAKLRSAGHDVHPVTLTGMGDRAHLGGPEVDLDTHITDVVNVLEYADLRDVVLVGHSYGGFPVTGAAERIPERIARLVYVESGPLPGMAQLDLLVEPERAAELRAGLAEGRWQLPLPDWDELGGPDGSQLRGLGPAERARLAGRAVDQPIGSVAQPLVAGDEPARNAIPHTLVTCSFSTDQVEKMLADEHPFFSGYADKEWTFAELPTGHWPMFSEPELLAEVLGRLSGRQG